VKKKAMLCYQMSQVREFLAFAEVVSS